MKKIPRYPIETINEGDERIIKEEELAHLIKPTIKNVAQKEMDLKLKILSFNRLKNDSQVIIV